MSAFISYSQEDRDFAERLSDELLKRNVKFWRDSYRMAAGDQMTERVMTAIQTSSAFVLLLSPRSLSSPWVARELQMAEELAGDGKLTIVPVVIEQCKIPDSLADRLHFDFASGGLEEGFSRLCSRLSKLAEHPLRMGRMTLDASTFTDHAIEVSETADGSFSMDLDIVSFDLGEQYTILSQFRILGQQPFSEQRTLSEQTDALLVSCAAAFKVGPFHVGLGSVDVHHSQFTLNDGDDLYSMTGRIRRLGNQGRGYVVFNAGALFELICDGYAIESAGVQA
jgi:TIR domain